MFPILKAYPDIVSSFAIPTILGIFTMMIPLLLSNIILISNKYRSPSITRLFLREPATICFIVLIILSIVALITWGLQLPRIFDFGCLNIIVDNSALIFLLTTSFALLFSAIWTIIMLIAYLSPYRLFRKICKCHWQKEATLEIIIYSIKAELPYIYDDFKKFYNDKCRGRLSEDDFFIIEKVIYAVCKTQKDKFFDFEIKEWFHILLKNYDDERTRQSIWKCIRCCIANNNDRFIKNYFEEAQEKLSKIDNEEFRLFNCMIGAMLLHCKKYSTLHILLSDYERITVYSLNDVMSLYNKFLNIKRNLPQNYPFPEIGDNDNIVDDIDDDYRIVVNKWCENFFALLFLKFQEGPYKVPIIEGMYNRLENLQKAIVLLSKDNDLLSKLGIINSINEYEIINLISYFELILCRVNIYKGTAS